MRFALSIAVLLASWTAAEATTVIPMSVEELTRAASQVVEAKAVSSRAAWNEQHTLIHTYTTYQVTRTLKGAATPTITVIQLGGSAGGYTQKVSGVHHAQAGDAALLFLRPSAAGDGTFAVVGLMQGNFCMYRASNGPTMVNNGITGAHALESGSGRLVEFTGSPMKITDAEARIRRALQ